MTTRARGRPRSFDTERALDRALDVFWTRGFSATSLDELGDAMGIARPSMYAAFGDKETLYLAALDRYGARIAETYRGAIAGAATRRDGILAFMRGAIGHYTSSDVPRGCLVVCTAATEAPPHPRVRAALVASLAALDAGFTAAVRQARERGELPASADVTALGTVLSSALQSIAIRARAGTPKAELERLASAAVAVVFGPAPKRRRR